MTTLLQTDSLGQSPFAALTFIAAPALLTNASSVLALSTINRMLRTRDRMHDLYAKSESGVESQFANPLLLGQVDRLERQGILLLRALYSIYLALGAFAAATLVTLVGAGLGPSHGEFWFRALVWLGLLLGFVGVGGLVFGSITLFKANQLSLQMIREEASAIRERQLRRTNPEMS